MPMLQINLGSERASTMTKPYGQWQMRNRNELQYETAQVRLNIQSATALTSATDRKYVTLL
jgi:hypothetical protein